MSKTSTPFEEIEKALLADEEFREEYDRLKPRYEVISQIIEARKENNMTQAELASLLGTQKSNISRLESGNYNPSLDFLVRIAHCLGKNIKIQIQ